MNIILSVAIVILIWRIGKIEDQLLEGKYDMRELRKHLWELELRDIEEEDWQKPTNYHDTQADRKDET